MNGTGLVVGLSLPGPAEGPAVRSVAVVTLSVFFGVVLLRIAVSAVLQPARRTELGALAAGICLWAAGSAVLNAALVVEPTEFPAPGEGLFLASYFGLALFLLLGVPRRNRRPAALWLDTVVLCGGAASLAGFLLLSPVAAAFGGEGLALLLALLYPMLDVALGLVVLGQILLRQRRTSPATLSLLAGFLGLAVADSSFVLNLASEFYVSGVHLDLLYGSSFALVVGAACAPRELTEESSTRPHRTRTLVLAAGVALVVLVLRPDATAGWYVVLPAVVTLVAAGGRLIIALREAQGAAEALRLSRTDELTGLPNRRAVLAEVDAALRERRPIALMLMDLDGFKEINDSIGHAAGDAVLVELATRLPQAVGAEVLVARLGGDEFALLLEDVDELALVETAGHVRDALLQPVHVDHLDLAVRASIGITVGVPEDEDATDLLRRADVAMYDAKANRAGAVLYDAARDRFSRQRLRLVDDLRRGIAEGQLALWYQPQVDAATQRVTGVEALVRWLHPVHGLLQPVAFLPAARKAGLMAALSEAVMRLAVADAKRWREQGFDFWVSFNCAPPELLSDTLVPQLFSAIAEADLPPDALVVEVTEDSFLSEPERARSRLHELREHRVQVAIDDYGTGFSSLAYLRDLPVQELKMDRSFVSTLTSDPRSRVIVASTTEMAHAMGLRLVAEGVEDSAAAAALVAMGVDVLQGYHLARPMPAPEVAGWVRRWSVPRGLDPVAVPRPRDPGQQSGVRRAQVDELRTCAEAEGLERGY